MAREVVSRHCPYFNTQRFRAGPRAPPGDGREKALFIENHERRESWPYPALLPYSLKAYPIVQIAPRIGPQAPAQWPPPMDPKVARWREQTASGTSLGNQIYLHVPFCPFICGFCPLFKVKTAQERTADKREVFTQALIREIELYGSIPVVAKQRYNNIYFGGGTPTELSPEQLTRILNALRTHLDITPDAEITLEGVAKQMLGPEYLARCIEAGFNRISFGVESLDPKLRKRIGRGDSISDYEATVALARKLSPTMVVNAEVMAAMPEQTLEQVEFDVREMIRWNLDSADVFYYVMMPGTKLERLVTKGERAEPRYGASMLKTRDLVRALFNEAGYHPVTGEVFTRSDRDLFTHTSFGGGGNALNTVLALGPSAFGAIDGTVYQNVCSLEQYFENIDAGKLPVHTATTMDLETAQRRAIILSVLRLELPDMLLTSYSQRRLVAKWSKQGLLRPVPGGHKLTERGLLWYNQMQMELLPLSYLIKAAGSMFGAVEEKKAGDAQVNTQGYELMEMIRSHGPAGVWAYKGFQALRKLPFFDSRPVGFTGTVEDT